MLKKILMLVALLLVAAGGFVAFKMLQPLPDNLDLARSRPSDARHFMVSVTPQDPDFKRNTMHNWIATVTTPDGAPVEGAVLRIDGGMPQHGHGLPTAPQVTTYLGDGQYLIEGVRFNMSGWWEFRLDISAGDTSDSITFNLVF